MIMLWKVHDHQGLDKFLNYSTSVGLGHINCHRLIFLKSNDVYHHLVKFAVPLITCLEFFWLWPYMVKASQILKQNEVGRWNSTTYLEFSSSNQTPSLQPLLDMMYNLHEILAALDWSSLALRIHKRHDHLMPDGMQLIL